MPRVYSRRHLSTWSDEDFKALDLAHQGLYDALCCYPKLSWCGVADYLPKQLIRCAAGLTETRLIKMVDHLRDRKYVLVDDSTDELLVRTFVRHDGVMKMFNMGKSMARDYRRIHSVRLRDAVVVELVRLREEFPDLKGWSGVASFDAALYDKVVGKGNDSPLFDTNANP